VVEAAPEAGSGLRTRVVRGATLAALGYLGSQVISLLTFIVLARLAPPAVFGSYAAAAILLGASLFLTEAGMQAAVVQSADHVQEAASTAFVANMVGALGLAALAAALGPVIGLFFHSGQISRAAAVMAGTILINAAAIVPGALLRRRVSFAFVMVEPIASLAYAGAAIAALAHGMGLWGLVIATYATACARTAAVVALARWRPSPGLVSWKTWRSLSAYGRPVLISSLLRESGSVGGTAIVGRILGTIDLGLFRSAQRFVQQANLAIIYGSGYALLPAFARIRHDELRLQRAILRSLRTLTLIVFPLSLVFIPLGRPLAVVLLGERWRGAGPIMMAMAGVGIALAFDSVTAEAFKATGRTRLLPRLHGLLPVAPVPFMLVLYPLGATGMGLALSLGMGTVAILAVKALGRLASLPIRTIVAQTIPASISALLMLGVVFALDRFVVHASEGGGLVGLARLGLDFLAAAVIYVAALSLLFRRSLLELIEIARLLVTRLDRRTPVVTG